ncbi:hypothetical protein LX32DRAFT_282241 [Colletotrichum zoysiae]|uniref:Uncharacterized protein n=1 Tax=Colletotrichum zoysiae TaxID=1216348 RepID=A0AAD9H2N6_9PEZI|nr:hypothetical protein LX32DRAFT_282241 [Colletotrichum zoysiae]
MAHPHTTLAPTRGEQGRASAEETAGGFRSFPSGTVREIGVSLPTGPGATPTNPGRPRGDPHATSPPPPPLRKTVTTRTTYLVRCPPPPRNPVSFLHHLHHRMRGKTSHRLELLSTRSSDPMPSSGTWGLGGEGPWRRDPSFPRLE